MSVGLKHGFFWAGAEGEPEIAARVATEVGRGPKKEKYRPELPTINYGEFQRGQREHVRQIEAQMWANVESVEQARKFEKQEVDHERTKERSHKKTGLPAPTRKKLEKDPVQSNQERMEANRQRVEQTQQTLEIQPSDKQIRPKSRKPVRRTDERIEAANQRAEEVREENRFKAHLQATKGIVEKRNIEEEKRQRTAEKDIGYTPTQIKRDRANRAADYQRRTDAMVNLEKAKRTKAQLQDVEDLRNKQRLAALKKARAAKKRKAKKRKK